LSAEYKELQGKAKKYRRSVLRRYGATDPAEFFAVATEAFLEKSKQMKKKHPELYEELKNYYNLDPAGWT
jgi:Mlc titration factor MtfA (ptsG expression regulator)